MSRLALRSELRVGIMGGAFDPIHIGHLVAAEEALHQFALDEIVFLPTGSAPHKLYDLTPADLRYTMTVLATAANPHFHVSRLEMDRPGTDYTVDTLQALRRLLPQAELFFITGADAVLDILSWKDPEGVLSLCTLIAATRPGYDLGRLSRVLSDLQNSKQVRVMETPGLAVSSSMIRQRIREGRSIRYLVPEGVSELVSKFGLYREGATGPAKDSAGRRKDKGRLE